MTIVFSTTISPRSTRDLRAEILSLATMVAKGFEHGELLVEDPLISEQTVKNEWEASMEALAPSIRKRMELLIKRTDAPRGNVPIKRGVHKLDRPNFRYEVLRLLIGASLEGRGPQLVRGIAEKIGTSEPTIRSALAELMETGTCNRWGTHYAMVAEDVTIELMARIRALPQVLRFRFAQGTMPRAAAELVERASLLLGPDGPQDWVPFSLSGTPVALATVPEVDLIGTPRLDLVAHVPREAKSIHLHEALRKLDYGLELEPNVLKPAPVVITVVRAKTRVDGPKTEGGVRCANAADVYLSLLDADFPEQGHQYAAGARP